MRDPVPGNLTFSIFNFQFLILNPLVSSSVWYILRTFNCQELKLSQFLTEKGCPHFIPMMYAEKPDRQGRAHRGLLPVVHNLLFLEKDRSERSLLHTLSKCPFPWYIPRKEGSSALYEIPDKEMEEFRALCDPNFDDSHFMSQEDAEAKPGKMVRIVHGPFAGMTGKLHRVRNKFYFIKTLAGFGVMIRISRWYCKVLDSETSL